MTPHKDHDRGTFVIDRRFPGVGRIKKASGTTDAKMYDSLNQMLSTLWTMGRADLLLGIQAGRLHLMIVWAAFRRGALNELPDENSLAQLKEAVETWRQDLDCSTKHRSRLGQVFKVLAIPTVATLSDAPQLLKAYRFTARTAGHHRSFNLARAALQAFLRDAVGKSHTLYGAVLDIRPLKVDRREGNPQSPEEARTIREALGQHGATWWSMCTTGMMPDELWGRKWRVGPNYVRILGTKRDARRRDVPLVYAPSVPSTETPNGFAQALRKATGGDVAPYDARRTYIHWLEEAGVTRTRRKLYAGHAAGDVTELYERHELARFLVDDAEKIRAYLGSDRPHLQVVEA